MTYTKIAVITGPTASGKSDLAMSLASHFSGEIISIDSMQLYRGMDIGTAKPTPEDMQKIKHHMVDVLDIHDSFSVVDYVKAAELCISNIYSKGKLPFFCGGTGLYVDALVNSTEFGDMENLPDYREELKEFAEKHGSEALHSKLSEKDPDAAAKIDHRNVKRVIRALEVLKATGMPISEWQRRSKLLPPKYDSLVIELEYEDRELLYERINKRVDQMIEAGLIRETKALMEKGLFDTATAGQAIGYKEFIPYFEGVCSLDECVERLKIESRRYAKRQMTWFRRNDKIKRIYADGKTRDEILDEAKKLCEEFFKPELIWSVKY
ncbi:MAG: tRNA (adenosine(37)-N6)-dimethylallyltransferase MiaA [Clostridia bacterium]|nr:tRNA (adenosine(37)-N6)-dimethylallyltransferase MiaA [Clostridia bacterium]